MQNKVLPGCQRLAQRPKLYSLNILLTAWSVIDTAAYRSNELLLFPSLPTFRSGTPFIVLVCVTVVVYCIVAPPWSCFSCARTLLPS